MIRTAGLFNCVYARGGDVLEKQRQSDGCMLHMYASCKIGGRERDDAPSPKSFLRMNETMGFALVFSGTYRGTRMTRRWEGIFTCAVHRFHSCIEKN
jgi:hypothetical protein